ncbi:MAG: tetratricopeptide repeat protein [Saprospiraceae bacterium]|nr:tetratricopeptide repeat protein [Saprospiraceae bacterium]MBK7811188.1 tetratricopeptide repeat protein [Saprospiraceae bacterium]MBK9631108.1 tetratricopeptide repeat protein [Saprospiraceae bacterium]
MRFISLLLIFHITAIYSIGQTNLEQAKQYYKDGQYAESEEIWKQYILEGFQNAEIFYHLANCHYQQKEFPQAILYYQKALSINPAFKTASDYLLKAQKLADVEPIKNKKWKIALWFDHLSFLVPSMVWLLLVSIGLSFTLFWSFIKPSRLKAIIFLGLSLISGILLARQEWVKKDLKQAWVVMDNVPARLSPDDGSLSEGQMKAGETVQVLEQIDDWVKVQSGLLGSYWVERNKLSAVK